MSKGGNKSKKPSVDSAQDSSETLGADDEFDTEDPDDEATQESDSEESVPVDLGEPDLDDDDAEGIEDVEKESLANRGDDDSAARTVAIRRALEERNERRRMAEDLDYLDFDD